MASIRKTTVGMQREASAKSSLELMEPSPSPKLSYSQSYVTMRGLANSLASLDFTLLLSRVKSVCAALCCRKSSRSSERAPRSKWAGLKKVAFRLFVFFMIGIFIGFMPFFFEVGEKISSESERLPFAANSILRKDHLKKNQLKEEGNAQETAVQLVNTSQSAASEVTSPALILESENPAVKEDREPPPALESVSANPDSHQRKATEVLFVSPSFRDSDIVSKKLLIIVTITSTKPAQPYHLLRLSHILKVVPAPLLWLVVDWPNQNAQTAKILQASGLMYRHLICRKNTTSIRKIISCQKNAALYHVKKHHLDGILHFADEEKVYLPEIFEEMRNIRRLGTWPVAIHRTKNITIEGPICRGDRVLGWHGDQRRCRYPVTYAGFAFNSTILWDGERWPGSIAKAIMVHTAGQGTQESRFIEKLVDNESQMQGLGENCSRIMAWNFNLEPPQQMYPLDWTVQNNLKVVVPIT